MTTQTIVNHLTGDLSLGLDELNGFMPQIAKSLISTDIVDNVVTRQWSDHGDAQQYLDFVDTLSTKYNFAISTSITDI